VQLRRLNPHWEMDKTFSPSYSPSQINYVEAEAVGFSRFRFHKKGPFPPLPLPASASTSLARVKEYAYYVNKLRQNLGLET